MILKAGKPKGTSALQKSNATQIFPFDRSFQHILWVPDNLPNSQDRTSPTSGKSDCARRLSMHIECPSTRNFHNIDETTMPHEQNNNHPPLIHQPRSPASTRIVTKFWMTGKATTNEKSRGGK